MNFPVTQSIWSDMPSAHEWAEVDAPCFQTQVEPLNRPAVLRGLVNHWPAVASARKSPHALADYLRAQGTGKEVVAFVGDPKIKGRFFYSEGLNGLNFSKQRLRFDRLVSLLLRELENMHAPALYAGAVPVAEYLPGLLHDHTLDLLAPSVTRQTSAWIGNRTRVAAHWDEPQNIACAISGRRRYTLFPPAQIKNLYIGPLDRTPAGAPVSMVDFHCPDYARFPRFHEALAHAEVAELEPGDALYMPNFWVHHAETHDSFGLMMNFWWKSWPAQQPSPFLTMLHSLLTIRDLPPSIRDAWRALFDLYVFQTGGDPMAHLPDEARGMFAAMTPERAHVLIAQLHQSLDRMQSAMQKTS